MLRKLRERIQSEEKGFTLIELLVVILIIGILAAIAIPAFLSQTDKADDAEAMAAARNAQTAAESYMVDNGGSYAAMDELALEGIEPTLTDATFTEVTGTEDTYSITTSSSTGNTFTVARDGTGGVTRTSVGGSW